MRLGALTWRPCHGGNDHPPAVVKADAAASKVTTGCSSMRKATESSAALCCPRDAGSRSFGNARGSDRARRRILVEHFLRPHRRSVGELSGDLNLGGGLVCDRDLSRTREAGRGRGRDEIDRGKDRKRITAGTTTPPTTTESPRVVSVCTVPRKSVFTRHSPPCCQSPKKTTCVYAQRDIGFDPDRPGVSGTTSKE